MPDTRVALLVLCCLTLPGCAVVRGWPAVCPDGAPLKILTHPDCDRGICGYTCHPDRWRVPKG